MKILKKSMVFCALLWGFSALPVVAVDKIGNPLQKDVSRYYEFRMRGEDLYKDIYLSNSIFFIDKSLMPLTDNLVDRTLFYAFKTLRGVNKNYKRFETIDHNFSLDKLDFSNRDIIDTLKGILKKMQTHLDKNNLDKIAMIPAMILEGNENIVLKKRLYDILKSEDMKIDFEMLVGKLKHNNNDFFEKLADENSAERTGPRKEEEMSSDHTANSEKVLLDYIVHKCLQDMLQSLQDMGKCLQDGFRKIMGDILKPFIGTQSIFDFAENTYPLLNQRLHYVWRQPRNAEVLNTESKKFARRWFPKDEGWYETLKEEDFKKLHDFFGYYVHDNIVILKESTIKGFQLIADVMPGINDSDFNNSGTNDSDFNNFFEPASSNSNWEDFTKALFDGACCIKFNKSIGRHNDILLRFFDNFNFNNLSFFNNFSKKSENGLHGLIASLSEFADPESPAMPALQNWVEQVSNQAYQLRIESIFEKIDSACVKFLTGRTKEKFELHEKTEIIKELERNYWPSRKNYLESITLDFLNLESIRTLGNLVKRLGKDPDCIEVINRPIENQSALDAIINSLQSIDREKNGPGALESSKIAYKKFSNAHEESKE